MKPLTKYIAVATIIFAVQGLWMSLELLFYGEVQPRAVDNFIGLILVASLYYNFKTWLNDFLPKRITKDCFVVTFKGGK